MNDRHESNVLPETAGRGRPASAVRHSTGNGDWMALHSGDKKKVHIRAGGTYAEVAATPTRVSSDTVVDRVNVPLDIRGDKLLRVRSNPPRHGRRVIAWWWMPSAVERSVG